MVSIKLSSVCRKTWQSGDVLWQYGAVRRGAFSMCPDSLYWQWLARTHRANRSFPLLWLTIWPLACIGFKHPLHAPHRLHYRCLWKINEGVEVNKGGFRRSSVTSLHLFSSSLWLWRDESTTKCLREDLYLVMYLACLDPVFFVACHFFFTLTDN